MTDFTMFDLKITDGVAVATFNRPDKMNTFTPVVMREMIFADTPHDRQIALERLLPMQRADFVAWDLEHPNELQGFMEINEESDVDDTEPDQVDASEDELQQRFDRMTFVVSTRKLESSPRWVKVSAMIWAFLITWVW